MKHIKMKLLSELLKNSKRSDREISKVLRVSQPTITRTRHQLESKGIIRDYTIIPDFEKLGYEILAIWVGRYKFHGEPELVEKWREWMKKHPTIMFPSSTSGSGGRKAVMISLHRSYSDYANFVKELVGDWSYILEHETLLVDLKGYMSRPLTLRYLAEQAAELLGESSLNTKT